MKSLIKVRKYIFQKVVKKLLKVSKNIKKRQKIKKHQKKYEKRQKSKYSHYPSF